MLFSSLRRCRIIYLVYCFAHSYNFFFFFVFICMCVVIHPLMTSQMFRCSYLDLMVNELFEFTKQHCREWPSLTYTISSSVKCDRFECFSFFTLYKSRLKIIFKIEKFYFILQYSHKEILFQNFKSDKTWTSQQCGQPEPKWCEVKSCKNCKIQFWTSFRSIPNKGFLHHMYMVVCAAVYVVYWLWRLAWYNCAHMLWK